jgi:hypothetical protein
MRLSRAAVIIVCGLALTAAGGALSHWGGAGRIASLTTLFVQATPTPTPLTLSKEYVYAGGRLVATEEPAGSPTPTPTPAAAGPSNLVATATAPTQVDLSWSPPPSGTVAHYVVERSSTVDGYAAISTLGNVTAFQDMTAATDTAYLYHVKAIFSDNTESRYSTPDLATTVVFTGDDEIAPGAVIRASQLNKLRRAVNAVRTLAGLPAYGWTKPDPVSSPASQRRAIYLEDVTDLRDALEGPLTQLGRSGLYPAYTAAGRGTVVQAAHFTEIKQRIE